VPAAPANPIVLYHAPPASGGVAAPQVVSMVFGLNDPTFFTNPLPAPAAWENTALSNSHRAYDRAVHVYYLGNAVPMYAWQGLYVFGNTAAPNWSAVHGPIPNLRPAVDYGVHTGLYVVQSRTGSRQYVCGLYWGLTSMGYVKCDLQTGTWTSAEVTGASPGIGGTFSNCVAWEGRLVTAYSGDLVFFDPATNEITQVPYASSTQYDKVFVARGRLFLVRMGGSNVDLFEWAFGGFAFVQTLFAHGGLSFASGADVTVGAQENNILWVVGPSLSGGNGFRAFKVSVLTDPPGTGTGILVEDKTAVQVDAVLAYPGSAINVSYMAFWLYNDNAYSPKLGGYTWSRLSNYGSTWGLFNRNGWRLVNWHNGLPWTYITTGGPNLIDKTHAIPQSPFGTMEYHLPEGTIQLVSATPYADATVSGMLLRFYSRQGKPACRFQHGNPIRKQALPDCTLSIGDGFTIAPGATLNVGDSRIDGLVNDGTTVHQIVWDYAADGVSDYAQVLVKAYGFTVGQEIPSLFTGSPGYLITTRPSADAPGGAGTPLDTSGPVQEILAMTDASPQQTSGPVQEILTKTDASPLDTSGPVQEVLTKTDASPTETSGPVQEIVTGTNLDSNLAQPVATRPANQDGGDFGFQLDGVEQSVRDEIDFVSSSLPGQAIEPDPVLPQGPEIGWRLDGVVELGRATVDAVNDAAATVYSILDLAAAGLDKVAALQVKVRLVAISGLVAQPTLSLGTNGTRDDQAGTQALTLTVVDQVEDLTMASPAKLARSGETIGLQLDGQATATTYQVEVVVYGFHRQV
jgi:hypothetical protein